MSRAARLGYADPPDDRPDLCQSCGTVIHSCELCEDCAKAQQPVDLEASGGWMVQDGKPHQRDSSEKT